MCNAINVSLTNANRGQLSRKELLSWVSELTGDKYTKVESLRSGTAYCLLMNYLFPGSVLMDRIAFTPRTLKECWRNFKLFQKACRITEVDKTIPIAGLVEGRFRENLEFLQWFKLFFDANYNNINLKVCSSGLSLNATSSLFSPVAPPCSLDVPEQIKDENIPEIRICCLEPVKSLGSLPSEEMAATEATAFEDVSEIAEEVTEEMAMATVDTDDDDDVHSNAVRDAEDYIVAYLKDKLRLADEKATAMEEELLWIRSNREISFKKLCDIERLMWTKSTRNPFVRKVKQILYELEEGFAYPDENGKCLGN